MNAISNEGSEPSSIVGEAFTQVEPTSNIDVEAMTTKEDTVTENASSFNQGNHRQKSSASTRQTSKEKHKAEEQSRRLIETLQREKSHLQNQCSALETAGMHAARHNAEMNRLIHNLQGNNQALRERNHYLTNHLNEVSFYMDQAMQNLHWHVNRVKVLELSHCNALKSYADLQVVCNRLVLNSNLTASNTRPNAKSTEVSIQTESVAISKQTGRSTSEESNATSFMTEKHRHRPFLQPKPGTHTSDKRTNCAGSIRHDLLLERQKRCKGFDSPSTSLSRSNHLVTSTHPKSQPCPIKANEQNDNLAIVGTSTVGESASNLSDSKTQKEKSSRSEGLENVSTGPDKTTVALQHSKNSAFITRLSKDMTNSHHVSPSPTIGCQVGRNQLHSRAMIQQHVHHHPYLNPQFFMNSGGSCYTVENEHMYLMNNQQVTNQSGASLVPHRMASQNTSRNAQNGIENKMIQRRQRSESIASSKKDEQLCATSRSRETKRRKVSISLD